MTRIVYAVAVEDDSSGMVDWWPERGPAEAHYAQALTDYPDDEVNLFPLEVDEETPHDEITSEVDGAMWDRDYTPMRWRRGKNHSAQPHDTPPTD